MYIISILAVIVISKFFTETSWFFYPLELLPLILILLFCFSLLTGAGLLKDFNNAFRLSIQKENRGESVNELRRAIEAVSLVRKILIATGAFIFFFEACQILCVTDFNSDFVTGTLEAMISNGLFVPLYSVTFTLVLLPVESMLKLKLWNAQKAEEVQKDRELLDALKGPEAEEKLWRTILPVSPPDNARRTALAIAAIRNLKKTLKSPLRNLSSAGRNLTPADERLSLDHSSDHIRRNLQKLCHLPDVL